MSKLTIRLATVKDLSAIGQIINGARKVLAEQHIPQWQDPSYPSQQDIRADLRAKQGWVLVQQAKVIGYAAIVTKPDAIYEQQTAMVSFQPATAYVVIHRLAIAKSQQGHHLGRQFLQLLLDEIRESGIFDVRIDTHPQNIGMQKTITACGFKKVGTIMLNEKPDPKRFAYQIIFS